MAARLYVVRRSRWLVQLYFLLGHIAGSAHSGQEHGTLSGKEPEPLSASPSTPTSTPVEKAESGFVPGTGLPAIYTCYFGVPDYSGRIYRSGGAASRVYRGIVFKVPAVEQTC